MPRVWTGSFRVSGGMVVALFALLSGLVCVRDAATPPGAGCDVRWAWWASAPLLAGLALAAWGVAAHFRARRTGGGGAAFPWRAGVALGFLGMLLCAGASLGAGTTCVSTSPTGPTDCHSFVLPQAALAAMAGVPLALVGFGFAGWNAIEHRRKAV